MKTIETISAYKVIWAELFPSYGVVTKHDRKAFGETLRNYESPKTFRKWFGTKDAALKFINEFDKKLDKTYTVRLFTDKQFSLAKRENGYAIPYTKKQWNETYEL